MLDLVEKYSRFDAAAIVEQQKARERDRDYSKSDRSPVIV
jgi:hypothetical protein